MADSKKKASGTEIALDPAVEAFLKEDARKKKKLLAEKEKDFAKPFDPNALLEVRHMRKCFPLKKNLLGKVPRACVQRGR